MQTLSGLHVASLIDPENYDVRLHHEDWHGPFDTTDCSGYEIVFLTGLQVDFDRMRQLAFHFRRAGALTVAGGSICINFPEFAAQFFDVVCAGGVELAAKASRDFLHGKPASIYRSPVASLGDYAVDYRHFARNGLNPSMHLMESSRGCTFKCSFCTMPGEVGRHAAFGLAHISAALDSALASTPRFSFRRWYPMVLFLDNNFSDNREHMLAVSELLRADKRVRGWAALVTQNILADRELLGKLVRAKCYGLFVGVESFDRDLLRRHNKTQNLGRRDIVDDLVFAESLGIGVTYGYLFDPRRQSAAEMRRQIQAIASHPLLPLPTYVSVIAPLAGTQEFWRELRAGQLAANLRLRDLDGETLAYARLADETEALVDFLERIFRRPWEIVGRVGVLAKMMRRLVRARTLNPVRLFYIAAANLHCFVWSRAEISSPRTYRAGSDALDPQYSEHPHDLSNEDRERYFDPIRLTDSAGRPAPWLLPYMERTGEAALRSAE